MDKDTQYGTSRSKIGGQLLTEVLMELEDKFLEFVKTIPGAEVVDLLKLDNAQQQAMRPDYFFDNRRFICEQKALHEDTSHKIDAILEPYRDSDDFPLFYGDVNLQNILKHLPEGKEINKRIIDKATDPIESHIEKANKQIRKAKDVFGLENSIGIVILLNQGVDVMDPEIISFRVAQCLQKKTQQGSTRFAEVAGVLVISEAHTIASSDYHRIFPCLMISNSESGQYSEVDEFLNRIFRMWAEFRGFSTISHDTSDGTGMLSKFIKVKSQDLEERTVVSRHELWRRQYIQKPYLRVLQEEELVKYGKQIFMAISPSFLIGHPKLPMTELGKLMEQWTHFLEEMNFRGVDMRKLDIKEQDISSYLPSRFDSCQN